MSLRIGKRFIICRGEDKRRDFGSIPVILTAGRAFGSGEHETTRSCLEELEQLPDMNGAKVLDIGCGTGILAIAAAGLGAGFVAALDPDPNAIKTAAANIRANQSGHAVKLVRSELSGIGDCRFDLVVANLYGDILLGIADRIAALVKPGGHILMSGIQYEYAYDLKTDLTKSGCRLLRSRYMEDFVTLLFRRWLETGIGGCQNSSIPQ